MIKTRIFRIHHSFNSHFGIIHRHNRNN